MGAQLTRLAIGNDARRYVLFYRALKQGRLTCIKRGLSVQTSPYAQGSPHPYADTQARVPARDGALWTAL